MRAIILQGDEALRTEFVNDFIRSENIPSYNIHRFEEELKIAEAREIKRILSRSAMSGRNRLIVVGKSPTAEAQNALLKAIEELPEDSFIIFSDGKELLPTIFSRCIVKTLGVHKNLEKSSVFPTYLNTVKSVSASEALLIADQLLQSQDNSIEELILTIRRELLLDSGDLARNKFLYNFFVNLNQQHSLVEKNNLNARLVVEKSLINAANEAI